MLCYVLLFFFFFFQAEDGIRDGRVTGVQTCALPIWVRVHFRSWIPGSLVLPRKCTLTPVFSRRLQRAAVRRDHVRVEPRARRSEERRVGKECRSRWWTYH